MEFLALENKKKNQKYNNDVGVCEGRHHFEKRSTKKYRISDRTNAGSALIGYKTCSTELNQSVRVQFERQCNRGIKHRKIILSSAKS